MLIGLAKQRGQNFCLGIELFENFQNAGFINPEISFVQPVVMGENKRLIDMSLSEARNALIEAGLELPAQIDRTVVQLKEIALDKTTIFGIPRVTQIWAKK